MFGVDRAEQARNRDLVLATITQDHLLKITMTAIDNAILGDPASRNWVTSFVLGNPEQIVKHKGDVDMPLKIVIETVSDRRD